MVRKIDWESQIGRRLRLRDLHVFSTVVQCGSMAKAAQQLGVSQPAVSEVIADLEHALGVRLLDRSSQGIEPTIYGDALLKRSVAVFDELKQSIRDIEFLSDATTGEVRIGTLMRGYFWENCRMTPWRRLGSRCCRMSFDGFPSNIRASRCTLT